MCPEIVYGIVNGPCRMDLMLALFATGGSHTHELTFVIDTGESRIVPVVVHLSGLGKEDKTGESWFLEARAEKLPLPDGGFQENVELSGLYHTRKRRGHFHIKKH